MGLFWANNSGNDGWETEISLCTMTALEMFKMFTNALIGEKKPLKATCDLIYVTYICCQASVGNMITVWSVIILVHEVLCP